MPDARWKPDLTLLVDRGRVSLISNICRSPKVDVRVMRVVSSAAANNPKQLRFLTSRDLDALLILVRVRS